MHGIAPFAAGAGVVGVWKPGDGFAIEQEGRISPAAGIVVGAVASLGGKKKHRKFLRYRG